ncbi:MAG: hypothetical protein ACI89L_000853 [Phycisphaerales bacterium]|jgi:hypothetical protein
MSNVAATAQEQRTVLIDAHVHLHPEHSLARVYQHAARRFGRADSAALGVLMLTHTTRARAQITDLADEPAGWSFTPVEPGLSGVARHAEHGELTLITGHQIVTRERIEVLSLATATAPQDGLTLEETLESVRAAGGLPVLPWGFGKWWGSRGTRVERVIEASVEGSLALGDNAGRSIGWPTPRLFGLAENRGIPVLPGTDPLAIPGHVNRPATFGSRVTMRFDPLAPAASILEHVRGIRQSPETFGRRTNPVSFALDQVSIRVRKATNTGGVA